MKNYAAYKGLRKYLKNSVLLLEEDCKVMSDTHVAYMVICTVWNIKYDFIYIEDVT